MTGVHIGVVAPGNRLDTSVPGKVKAVAANYGGGQVEILFHDQCFLSAGHFAGDDETRAAAFLDIANDPSFDALWFARGGYGAGRLLPRIVPKLTETARAKAYLGYSDAGVYPGGAPRPGLPESRPWTDGLGYQPGRRRSRRRSRARLAGRPRRGGAGADCGGGACRSGARRRRLSTSLSSAISSARPGSRISQGGS